MVLEVDGWIDGITASGVVIFGIIFGLFFIYRSKKTNAKLLAYLGLTNIFAGLVFMGVFVDFLFVLIIQENIINTDGIVAILSYIWFAPVIITAMYIGAELLTPKEKKYIVLIFLVISLIFEIVIFIDPLGSFNFDPVPPIIPSANFIDYNVNFIVFNGINNIWAPLMDFLNTFSFYSMLIEELFGAFCSQNLKFHIAAILSTLKY